MEIPGVEMRAEGKHLVPGEGGGRVELSQSEFTAWRMFFSATSGLSTTLLRTGTQNQFLFELRRIVRDYSIEKFTDCIQQSHSTLKRCLRVDVASGGPPFRFKI